MNLIEFEEDVRYCLGCDRKMTMKNFEEQNGFCNQCHQSDVTGNIYDFVKGD